LTANPAATLAPRAIGEAAAASPMAETAATMTSLVLLLVAYTV
jgi:hypothetical protein